MHGQEGDFFDTHLSKLLTPPSFIQAGPNLLQGGSPEVDKPQLDPTPRSTGGNDGPQPASFWQFGFGAQDPSLGGAPPSNAREFDVQGVPGVQAGTEAHHYPEGRSSRSHDRYGPPPLPPDGSRAPSSRGSSAHSSRGSTAHPVEPLIEVWHAEDHQERSPKGSASQAFCGLPLGCKSCASAPNKKCCRCKQLGSSYFDHVCPQCKVMVCLACLDDFRMILTTFRCPKCGEEAENRAALQHEIWMINIFRSAERVVGTVGAVAKHVVTLGSGSSAHPPSAAGGRASTQRLAPGEVRPSMPASDDLVPAVPEHGTRLPANWYPPARGSMVNLAAGPGACGRKATAPPPPAREEAAVPEHQTRLPVNWQAIMAAGGPGGLHRSSPPPPDGAEYHTFPPVRH